MAPVCSAGDCVSNATDQGARGLRPVQALQGAVGAAIATGRRNFNEAQVPSFSSRARVFPRFLHCGSLLPAAPRMRNRTKLSRHFSRSMTSIAVPRIQALQLPAVLDVNIGSPSQRSVNLHEPVPDCPGAALLLGFAFQVKAHRSSAGSCLLTIGGPTWLCVPALLPLSNFPVPLARPDWPMLKTPPLH